MSTPSAESEERLYAARVGLFHLRLQLHTHTSRSCVQQKTEMEKSDALELQPFLQLRPGCQVAPVSPE